MRKFSIMAGRIVAICLAFVLGFFSAFGAIAGGIYLAYSKISVDKINEWCEDLNIGFRIPTDKIVNPDADKPITSLTMQALLQEVQTIKDSTFTLNQMIERYGLILPEDIVDKVPDPIMNGIPFTALFSAEGVDTIMENVTVTDVLAMIPEDIAGSIVSDPMRDELSDNTLADIVEMDMGHIFNGIELGYVTGVHYEKDEEGTYHVVLEDPENPSILELIAPLDLGGILAAVSNGEGDILEVIDKSIGDVAIKSLFGTFMAEVAMLSNIIGEATLDDLLVENKETGRYELDIMVLMNEKQVGILLGYTKEEVIVDPETSDVDYIWKDANDEKVMGITARVANIKVTDLMDGSFSTDTLIEGLTIAEVLEYERAENLPAYKSDDLENPIVLENEISVWYQKGAVVDKMMGAFADKTLDWLTAELSTLMLSDILGYYELCDDEWYTWEVKTVNGEDAIVLTPADGIMAKIADTSIGNLDSVEGTLKGIPIGELLGHEPVYAEDESGNPVYEVDEQGNIALDENGNPVQAIDHWVDANGEPVTGVMSAFVDLTIAQMSDGEAVQGKIDGIKIADVLGYTPVYVKDEEGNNTDEVDYWITGELDEEGNPVRATGVMGALAGSTVGSLSGDINGMAIGKLLGHTPSYKDDEGNPVYKKDADGNIVYDEEGKPIPEIHHWEDSKGNKVTGVMSAFVDLTIEEMSDSAEVQEKINGITIADVMGYTPVYVKDEEGNNTNKVDYWITGELDEEDNPVRAAGVMGALAGSTVGSLSDDINDMEIGKLLGHKAIGAVDESGNPIYKKDEHGEIVLDKNGDPVQAIDHWEDANNKPVTGVMSAFVDLTIEEMSDGDTVQKKIDKITIADVMGYTPVYVKDEEGNNTNKVDYWITGELDEEDNPVRATGVMGALAGSTVGSLSDDINDMEIGELLGHKPVYVKDEFGKDTEVVDHWEDSEGNKVTGVMSAFVDLTIEQMSDGDEVQKKIDNITIAEVMGYTKDGEGWKKGDEPVTGVMGALADSKVKDLSNDINEMAIGEMLSYTAVWTDEQGNPVYKTDANGEFILDENNNKIPVIHHWEDADGNEVTGVMAAFAGLSINEMSEGDAVQDAIQDIKVADVLGLEKDDETGDWYNDENGNGLYDNGEKATGVMAALADAKVGEISDKMDEMTIGQMLGNTPEYKRDGEGNILVDEDGNQIVDYWVDSNGARVTGVVAALSDTSVGNLNTRLNEITVGEVLGYTPVYKKNAQGEDTEEIDYWLTGKNDVHGNPIKASGVTGALADTKLNGLDSALNTLKIGEIAGYTRYEVEEIVDGQPKKVEYWCDCSKHGVDEDHQKASGILGSLADLTVDQITDNEELTSRIGSVTLAEALGYKKNNAGKWCDKNGNELTGIMAKLAVKPIDEMNTAIDDLTLDDVIPGEKTGLLSIIPGSTQIDEINVAINNSITNTPLQFFIDEKLIEFDNSSTLDALSLCDIPNKMVDPVGSHKYPSYIEGKVPEWRTKSLTASFDYIVTLLSDTGNTVKLSKPIEYMTYTLTASSGNNKVYFKSIEDGMMITTSDISEATTIYYEPHDAANNQYHMYYYAANGTKTYIVFGSEISIDTVKNDSNYTISTVYSVMSADGLYKLEYKNGKFSMVTSYTDDITYVKPSFR